MSYHELTEKIYRNFTKKDDDDEMIREWLFSRIAEIPGTNKLAFYEECIRIFGLTPAPKKGIEPFKFEQSLELWGRDEALKDKLNEFIAKLNDMDKGE